MAKIKVSKEEIDKLIDSSENFVNAFVLLYKAVVKDFDDLESVGWPKCTRETSKYILTTLHNKYPDKTVDINLTWLNKGFGVDDKLSSNFVFDVPKSIKKYHE